MSNRNVALGRSWNRSVCSFVSVDSLSSECRASTLMGPTAVSGHLLRSIIRSRNVALRLARVYIHLCARARSFLLFLSRLASRVWIDRDNSLLVCCWRAFSVACLLASELVGSLRQVSSCIHFLGGFLVEKKSLCLSSVCSSYFDPLVRFGRERSGGEREL
jgi:hypothetical protein